MTEEEWLACARPVEMLSFIGERRSDRAFLLLATACCWRMLEDMHTTESHKRPLEIVELFADRQANIEDIAMHMIMEDDEMTHWPPSAQAVCNRIMDVRYPRSAAIEVCGVTAWTTANLLVRDGNGQSDSERYVARDRIRLAELSDQANLCRDIFGNPFRPVTFSPSWRSDTTLSLAREMYDSRDFSAMPILADALQDAGCDNDDVLNHCRGPGPHVRGCWVVDLVLGRE